jgi:glucose/arabinose dehydrogenase
MSHARLLAASCLLPAILTAAAHAAVPPIDTVEFASGFAAPIFATSAPGDFSNLYVVERGSGTTAAIKTLNLTTKAVTPFFTLSNVSTAGEGGLLGMAFDPNYQANKVFYVHYTAVGGTAGLSTISAYQVQPAGNPTLVGSAPILTFDQPQANHNGGWIGFSQRAGDGNNLYIATGDGGNGFDQGPGHIEPGGNAQSNQTLLGKILRINVNPVTGTYTVPSSNPLFNSVDPLEKKEIFAKGLRNPFRASFDNTTGFLYIGDVGQGLREEISVQKNAGGGENFGWRLREGTVQTPGVGGAPPAGNVDPIFDYPRNGTATEVAGRTVTGGYVYRGSLIPDLVGTYIFGDYNGTETPDGPTAIFAFDYDGTTVTEVQNLTSTLNPGGTRIGGIASFAEGPTGELFVLDINTGKIFAIVAVPEPATLGVFVLGAAALLTRRRSSR